MVFEYMQWSLYYINQLWMTEQIIIFFFQKRRSEHVVMCVQIFQGLAHKHHKGYINSDVKHENLLVSNDVIKIADFGKVRWWIVKIHTLMTIRELSIMPLRFFYMSSVWF